MRRTIEVRGARTHNLKGVDVSIPHRRLTVVTGVSGSGKSSLAFDTLYAEGQMRYVESLSAYSRQFLEQMQRPPVDSITGLPPAIALEQRNTVKNARSTVGTATEIADYLRLLFASVGETSCPECGLKVEKHTIPGAVDACLMLPGGSRLLVVAPVACTAPAVLPPATAKFAQANEDGFNPPFDHAQGPEALEGQSAIRNPQYISPRPWESLRRELERQGFHRLWIGGRIVEISDADLASSFTPHSALRTPHSEIEVVIDRLVLADAPAESRSRLAEALETAFKAGAGRAAVLVMDAAGAERGRLPFDVRFNCARCGRVFPDPEPQLFSFNSAVGACPTCQGFGRTSDLDPDKIVPDARKSIDSGAIACWQTPAYKQLHKECRRACHRQGVRTDVPYVDLSEADKRFIWDGDGDWIGVRGFFDWLETKRYKVHVRVMIARYRGYYTCPTCGGRRLRPEALNVRVGRKTIADLALEPVKDLRAWFDALGLGAQDEEKAAVLLREIRSRLTYLDDVGLAYLTLDRQTRSLSGGESQRINLASALGSSLTNTLYVLDEPTVGLHARDTHRLLGILRGLIAKGNTVVVVEHDPEMIGAAEHLVDLGPGAGEAGGEVIFEGPYSGLAACEASETARQLATHAGRAMSPYGRRPKGWIALSGAREHNLKNLSVRFPLGLLACVTGVSGSGKTTLVHHCLYGQFMHARGRPVDDVGRCDALEGIDEIDDIVLVDQSPIGLSTRSNPITYVKAYTAIRSLLAQTPKARVGGVTAANFSFNVAGGRCEVCKGVGAVTHDMYFMADVTVVCQECGGKRFKKKVLDVRWEGKNIDDILAMTVQEARAHFREHKELVARLQPLADVGLGYLRLGQSTASLSGGEAQRLKLASYLAAPKKGRQHLFIFDEPTTGLHLADIQVLLKTFHRLVHAGHSL
ncbi:MAG: excinuclease ABC subunit UvrA, partial [Planctomycetota bacterium]|nr:excinuclease ABC subunit UvrA [Planctomycetota bacterium]